MFYISSKDNKGRPLIITELSPETKEEEEILRNAKIIHKNQIQVWWGDTLELDCNDKAVLYDGLKISFKIPEEDINEPEEIEQKILLRPKKPMTVLAWKAILKSIENHQVIPIPDGLEIIVMDKDGKVEKF